MNTIVIGTDGSPSAQAALGFAVELCQDTAAHLHVLAVQPPPLAGRAGSLPIVEVEEAGGAERIAERAAEQARAAGIQATPHSAHGAPADVLAATAGELDADLLVVGSRGLGKIGSLLMGSVSRSLIKRSQVPVTVVMCHHDREPAVG